MKVAIIGAGVMGGLLGPLLEKAGADVTLITRNQENLQAIRENGLLVRDSGYDFRFDMKVAQTAWEVREKMDLILILVKGTQTAQAVDAAKVLATDDTYIMTLQNGIGNVDVIARSFPKEKILYGIMEFAGKQIAPGHVEGMIGDESKIAFGPASKKIDEGMKVIASLFEKTQLKVEFMEDVDKEVWIKLRNNSANVLFGFLRLNMGEALAADGGEELVQMIRQEVIAVAKAKGITFTDEELGLVEEDDGSHLGLGSEKPPVYSAILNHLPSTALDMKNKKETEVELLNGYIVREGKKLGVPTPYNELLYKMVKVAEKTYESQY